MTNAPKKRIIVLTQINLCTVFFALLGRCCRFSVFHVAPITNKTSSLLDAILRLGRSRPVNFEDCDSIDIKLWLEDPKGIVDSIYNALDYSDQHTAIFASYYQSVHGLHQKLGAIMRTYIASNISPTLLLLTWMNGMFPRQTNITLIGSCTPFQSMAVKFWGQNVRYLFSPWLTAAADVVTSSLRLLTTKIRILIKPRATSHPQQPRNQFLTPPHKGILFFPHKSPEYGALFSKDHYYSIAPQSPFYPQNMLHVEYNVPDASGDFTSISTYYKSHNIPHIFIATCPQRLILKTLAESLPHLLKALATQRISYRYTALITGFLSVVTARYLTAKNALQQHQPISMALIGYDNLFPKHIWLALESLGVPSYATQERINQAYYPEFSTATNTYFTGCPEAARLLQKRKANLTEHYVHIGLIRSTLLHTYRDKSCNPYVNKLANTKKHVLVLDYHSSKNPNHNALQPTANWLNNRAFLEDILSLAQKHTDTHFYIRGKNTEWTEIPYFFDIASRINAQPNITINNDYTTRDATYMLGALVDLVIAKYTSFGDECLSMGIPVIFHDYGPNIPHIVHKTITYNNAPVFARSFVELEQRVRETLYQNKYMPSEQFIKLRTEFFGITDKTSPTEKLKMILNEQLLALSPL